MASRRRTPAEVEEIAKPVRMVNGLKVVQDEDVMSPLGNGSVFRGLRALTLEDGTELIGCAECDFAGTRGAVLKHRMQEHGAGKGGVRRRGESAALVSDELLGMTVAELLEFGREAAGLSVLVDTISVQREQIRTEYEQLERQHRRLVTALDRAGFTPKVEEDD